MGKKLVAKPVSVLDVGNKQAGAMSRGSWVLWARQEATSSGDICGAPFPVGLVSGAGENDAQDAREDPWENSEILVEA